VQFSLSPLLESGPVIVSHALAAAAALVLGGVQFLAPKGTVSHRVVGYAWAGLMLWIAGSSFWIQTMPVFAGWSPIHILSVVVLVSVPLGVRYARRQRVAAHRSSMIQLYLLALIGAGVFTLYPGRILYQVVFGS